MAGASLMFSPSDSHLRVFCPVEWRLVMSADIFGCHNRRGGAIGIEWVEAKDTAKSYYNVQGSPHNKALTGPKCQSCWAWEAYKLMVLVCKADNLGKFIKIVNEYHPERNIANHLLASAGGCISAYICKRSLSFNVYKIYNQGQGQSPRQWTGDSGPFCPVLDPLS